MAGTTLGLTSPPGCTDGDAGPCQSDNLVWQGYATYPAATLSAENQTTLAASPFIRSVPLPPCTLDCLALYLP